jgi:hypothetical protein
MNALSSRLGTDKQIGSLRALVPPGAFIRALFITETMTLTLAAAAVGVHRRRHICARHGTTGISLNNPLLAILSVILSNARPLDPLYRIPPTWRLRRLVLWPGYTRYHCTQDTTCGGHAERRKDSSCLITPFMVGILDEMN